MTSPGPHPAPEAAPAGHDPAQPPDDPAAPLAEDEDDSQPEAEASSGPPPRIGAARALGAKQQPAPVLPDPPETRTPAEDTAPRGPVPDAIRRAWPAYFDSPEREATPLFRALPRVDADLSPFLDCIIPGPKGPTWAGRIRAPIGHFRALEAEFGTCPRIAHLLACVIVILRREPQNRRARRLFRRITAEHGAEAAAGMSLRWLTAVCDSFVDAGAEPLDRALGMTGTLLSNTLKLAETERRMFYPPRAWPPATALRRVGHMYDGVIGYWVGRGDMIENLLDRVERALQTESPAVPFLREVLERCFTENTVLRRMLEVQDGRSFPLAPEARLEAAKKAMEGL